MNVVGGLRSVTAKALRGVANSIVGSPIGLVRDWYAGAWQQNKELYVKKSERYYAAFACMTLIARDISKLPIKVVTRTDENTWDDVFDGDLVDIISDPNSYQYRGQFIEHWILSKLLTGNTYVVKIRDERGKVIGGNIVDPTHVTVLVSEMGNVFYQLNADPLTGRTNAVTLPASEVIHDRFNCLYHPLVGLSPLYAAALAASQGLAIQKNSIRLFNNGGQGPGIIQVPGQIDQSQADEMKAHWETNYGGPDNVGKIAILSAGMTFSPSSFKNSDSQLIEQLKWTAEVICGVFHVPPYMIGVGATPSASNVQSLILQYYSQCLQSIIEDLEVCLDKLVEAEGNEGYEVDVDALLRMDSASQAEVLTKLVGGSVMKINEARKRVGLKDTEGGDSIFMQQQNYSLAALIKRDSGPDPFAKSPSSSTTINNQQPQAPAPADDDEVDMQVAAKMLVSAIKSIGGEE